MKSMLNRNKIHIIYQIQFVWTFSCQIHLQAAQIWLSNRTNQIFIIMKSSFSWCRKKEIDVNIPFPPLPSSLKFIISSKTNGKSREMKISKVIFYHREQFKSFDRWMFKLLYSEWIQINKKRTGKSTRTYFHSVFRVVLKRRQNQKHYCAGKIYRPLKFSTFLISKHTSLESR